MGVLSKYNIVRHKLNRGQRMTNLLQENKEIEILCTNCTFGFLLTRKIPTLKKPKEQFYFQRSGIRSIFEITNK